MPDKKKPVASFGPYYSGGSYVETAIWENESAGEAQAGPSYAVSFSRSYKDGEEWKRSKSLRAQDIPVLKHALQECYGWLLSRREARQQESQ
ncbi:MAG: hypothetical protein AAF368_03765 [Planctomycetota bacterium]